MGFLLREIMEYSAIKDLSHVIKFLVKTRISEEIKNKNKSFGIQSTLMDTSHSSCDYHKL